MYSPDSAFTGRHPVVGPYPARMTRTRNYEFDFMSCFSKHISDYEKAGRKGSAANYRSSYRLLLSFLDGQHRNTSRPAGQSVTNAGSGHGA